MTKLSLNKPFLDLDGNDIPNQTMCKNIASAIAQFGKGDTLKLWGWALSLNKGEDLTLDDSDLEAFKKIVKETTDNQGGRLFNVLAEAQILLEIKEAEKRV